MKYLVVCNTASNSINRITISNLEVEELCLNSIGKPIGPSGAWVDENNIYTVNHYSNSISIINKKSFKEKNNLYVGAHPNDLIKYKNFLYIVCSESNIVSIYDLEEDKVVLDIPVNNWPYNIEISKEKEIIFISNFQSNNLSVIDINQNKVIKEIKTFGYPTKIRISNNKRYFYVCESFIGDSKDGYVEIFDLESLDSIAKIKVGRYPVDIVEDEGYLYVCNFGEGSISIIDIISLKEYKRIQIGGMPKSIIKYGENTYILDYLRGKLIIFNLLDETVKVITVGKEPNAMTLY
ncbi:YncE family protein [Clostridium sp.]|uniref:YncE family protein n=1 Tax=Clostridium sp. TaxID=1506 RepID=UPI00260D880D|nr:YncE family protein [Clostridium sp.]